MQIQQILLLCGAIAGPLFVIVFLIEGATRSGYDAMRQPVSALAIGERGWIQRANFFITGALMFACAFGLRLALIAYGGSFWFPILIGIYALGLIGAGCFVTDVTGLPTDTSKPVSRTKSGKLHDLSSLPVFLALFIAFFVFAHLAIGAGQWGWALYSILSGLAFGPGFVLAGMGFSGSPQFARSGGLWQRLTIAIGWIWIALVAAHLL
jgi:hypothetical protein